MIKKVMINISVSNRDKKIIDAKLKNVMKYLIIY